MLFPIFRSPGTRLTFVNCEEPKNAPSPVEVTVDGIVTLIRLVKANIATPRIFNPFVRTTELTEDNLKLLSPMKVTVEGIIIDVSEGQL